MSNSIKKCANSEHGYYTRESDGASGMTVTALADFTGNDKAAISRLLVKTEDANPLTNELAESLKPFAGKELKLLTNDLEGRMFILDDVCQAVCEYYAFDARQYNGKEVAIRNFRTIAKAGMRLYIWSQTGYDPTTQTNPVGQPFWYRRLMLYREKTKVPVGYFSVFEEIISLIGDLEAQGYVVPTGCIPDISVGKCWAFHLQKVEKLSAKNVGKKYKHYYPDWTYPIEAFIYPLELLPKFRVWMEEMYKPLKMMEYFRKKDPSALPSVCKLLGLPEGK